MNSLDLMGSSKRGVVGGIGFDVQIDFIVRCRIGQQQDEKQEASAAHIVQSQLLFAVKIDNYLI